MLAGSYDGGFGERTLMPVYLTEVPPRRHTLLLSILTPLNWGPELVYAPRRGHDCALVNCNPVWVLPPTLFGWCCLLCCRRYGMHGFASGRFSFSSCRNKKIAESLDVWRSLFMLCFQNTRYNCAQPTRPITSKHGKYCATITTLLVLV